MTFSPLAIAGFHLPDPPPAAAKLQRILNAALPLTASPPPALTILPWSADFLHLTQVSLFQTASPDEQQQILAIANQAILTEAYWIEQAGIGYMAKMIFLAESQAERMLYGLFVADETQHLAQIQQFLPTTPLAPTDPFLGLLAEVVESSDKVVLQFILQVVLEGWGLTHYRQLAAACQQPVLQHYLQGFIAAEARHHATGIAGLEGRSLTAQSEQTLLDILRQFLPMIQAGPQRLVSAIAHVKGHLSRSQRHQILAELNTLDHSGQRLKTLQHLMQTPATQHLVDQIAAAGYFQPWSAQQAADYTAAIPAPMP